VNKQIEGIKFKSLLEIREFLTGLLAKHKNLRGPDSEYLEDKIFLDLKSKGFTKFWSKKSRAYLQDKLFFDNIDDTYIACIIVPRKKLWGLISVSLSRIVMEEKIYYVGNIKERDTIPVIAPHFFHRYRERNEMKTLDDAIYHFINTLLGKEPNIIKIPNSKSGEVMVRFKMGVGLGHMTTLGIQKKEVIFFKTFVDNSLLTEEQIKLLDVKSIDNKEMP
jgi:hypothetical protein